MLSYWTSFVREGAPKAQGHPAWPRFTEAQRGYLDLDDRPSPEHDLQPGAFAFADSLVASRLRQGRGWRLDIGFSADDGVDVPATGRQPTGDEQHR
jgi:para-nitrobenzyl esterase